MAPTSPDSSTTALSQRQKFVARAKEWTKSAKRALKSDDELPYAFGQTTAKYPYAGRSQYQFKDGPTGPNHKHRSSNRKPSSSNTNKYRVHKSYPKRKHTYFDDEGMSQPDPRTSAVQKLLQQNSLEFQEFKRQESSLPLEFRLVRTASELSESDLEACFALIEQTSGNDYKASSIGWKPKQKKEEMMDKSMMYLLVQERISGQDDRAKAEDSSDGNIVGFMSFMFTQDDPPHEAREVAYIYEIHLQDSIRGMGLGSHLINFVEQAAQGCNISKTMLTVFKANEGAQALYKKLGYVKDDCSPKDRVVRRRVIEADYVIMSKELA